MVGVSLVPSPAAPPFSEDRVGVDGVLASLDRRARRTVAPGLAVRRALTWDAADRRDPEWWPQGVAVSEDVLAVSWYSRTATRISFLDLRTRRYTHAALVTPSLEPVRVHAGGLAWVGSWLYVCATRRGLLACHLPDLARTPSLVLPVARTYRATGDLRFSFCSSSPSSLVVGEYGSGSQSRRLARFPLDPDTGQLRLDASGACVASVVDDGVVPRTQGVVDLGERLALTRSRGPWRPGSVWSGPPGALRERRWAVPMGPEDLALSPDGDLLWTVTEHPRRRWICGVPRRLVDAG